MLDQNESKINREVDCANPQDFNTFNDFFYCFRKLFYDKLGFSIFLVLLIFFIGFLNLLVVVLLVRKRSKMTIFDKLIISLCLCDALIGILDAPFYSIIEIMGYWPFKYTFEIIWTAFDSGINTVNMSCMLYMTYVRLRSLQAPTTFEKELLIRKPLMVAVFYWTIGYSIWIPITIRFGTDKISGEIEFEPYYLAPIIHFFLYFLPLAIIMFMGFYIVVLLYIRKKKKNDRRKMTIQLRVVQKTGSLTSQPEFIINQKKKLLYSIRDFFHFGPQTKFQFIIISYWLQWMPSFLIDLFEPFCQCVPDNVDQGIYWMTFTVGMTNPIMVLLFNPNVVISKSNLARRINPI